MEIVSLVDKLLPGMNSPLDRLSNASQTALRSAAESTGGRPITWLLRGNEWLGHPTHPVVVALPIGAWTLCGWYDARSAASGDPQHENTADAALRFGIVGALAAATTGLAQYLDTRDGVRRETAVHAALNNVALGLYVGSWAARQRGRRPLGRRLAALGLSLVGVSGFLGGDIAFRHGVGVRPQALRAPDRAASDTSDVPIETTEARHS